MKTVGSLILLVGIAMLVVVGTISMSSITEEAASSNDTNVVQQSGTATDAISPILTIFGFLVLVVGAMIAINAFR